MRSDPDPSTVPGCSPAGAGSGLSQADWQTIKDALVGLAKIARETGHHSDAETLLGTFERLTVFLNREAESGRKPGTVLQRGVSG